MRNIEVVTCETCGFSYGSGYAPDERAHNKYCSAFCTALEEFGDSYVMNYRDRENLKKLAYKEYLNSNSDANELIEGYTMLLRTDFARSLEFNEFTLSHPCFDKYVGMRMYDGYFDNMKNAEVLKWFERYNTEKSGLNKLSYWKKSNGNSRRKRIV